MPGAVAGKPHEPLVTLVLVLQGDIFEPASTSRRGLPGLSGPSSNGRQHCFRVLKLRGAFPVLMLYNAVHYVLELPVSKHCNGLPTGMIWSAEVDGTATRGFGGAFKPCKQTPVLVADLGLLNSEALPISASPTCWHTAPASCRHFCRPFNLTLGSCLQKAIHAADPDCRCFVHLPCTPQQQPLERRMVCRAFGSLGEPCSQHEKNGCPLHMIVARASVVSARQGHLSKACYSFLTVNRTAVTSLLSHCC